jgi:cell shape-determining protein MreC
MVLVHHFDGVSDHVETLSNKKFPADALKPGSFPKGQYFAVGQKDFQVKKIAVPHSSAKDNASESGKLAAANKELRSLRDRLTQAEAENQRLRAQIAKPSDNQSLSAANAAAVKEEPQLVKEPPRLSQ